MQRVWLLKGIFRNSKCTPKGRRWNFEDKMLALSLLKRSPKSYSFLRLLLPLPSRRTLQSVLSTVHFAASINAHVFGALQHSLQKMSNRDWYCCLLFNVMSERMSVSIRRLTVLRVLRTVEQRGLAVLQIMLFFSWSERQPVLRPAVAFSKTSFKYRSILTRSTVHYS
jgi:hypothetical protein